MNDDEPLAIAQSALNDVHAITTIVHQQVSQPTKAILESALFILDGKLKFQIEKLGGPKAVHDT
jgi:hypothetical protein